MCGIVGVVSSQPLTPSQLEHVSRMNEGLRHRGPDGAGRYQAPQVALAMRRLSIIDPATGWQPLYNEDETIALIANAEIYNYIELRDLLIRQGHRFRTFSDCEVIVHLYEEHGDHFVDHLRGMFALALWDDRKRRLVLARDRMGEKPLYLYERDGHLVFASELKTLLHCGGIPFKLDVRAIDRYFHYQYVPEPDTPIEGVRKLPPAHLLAVATHPWSISETCYWRMEDAPPLAGDPAELIRAELESISGLVVRSDVPVGIGLSGGLDSSAIAVLTAKKYPGSMHAFTVGYSRRPYHDERGQARALAEYLGMPFHEVEVDTEDVVQWFPELVYWQDDPIADIAAYGYYAISRAAKEQQVPVILQGHGGDELFWGYPWVKEAARQSLRKALIDPSKGPRITEYLRPNWPAATKLGMREWIVSAAGLRSSWDHWGRDRLSPPERLVFYDLTADFQAGLQHMAGMYPAKTKESLAGSGPFDAFTIPRPWPQIDVLITRLICQTYLLENGITQGDRLSMASSVELRLPFVDFRLVETVIGLRKTHSDLRLSPKAWFKAAVKDVVPKWVLTRRKRGFQPPARKWHRALFARHGHLLDDGVLVQLGILQPEAARSLRGGAYPFGENIPLSFKALVLEVWCRQFLSDGDRARELPQARERAGHRRAVSGSPSSRAPHLVVFEPDAGGHHADYLRHLLESWAMGSWSGRLTVAIAPEFALRHPEVLQAYGHRETGGATFVTIEEQLLARIGRRHAPPWMRYGFGHWWLATLYAKQLRAGHCLLTYFDYYQLPMAMHLPSPCPMSGIYFRPMFHYGGLNGGRQTPGDRLRAWRQLTLVRRSLGHPSMGHLFCLDELAAEVLQRTSDKVVYLPDPVSVMTNSEQPSVALLDELQIGPGRKILLMFGDFRRQENLERKGLTQTLAALRVLPDETARRCCLVVAGQVSELTAAWLEGEFATVQRLRSAECRLINRYMAEEEAQAVFRLADLVLIPYQRHVGMSGVLVRAAAAGVPVMASDYGLIGALVRRHHLGWVVDGGQAPALAQALVAYLQQELDPPFDAQRARHFAAEHSGETFARFILERIFRGGPRSQPGLRSQA
jgi:asparagine synthase (glutamine-hydrolysing)